MDEQDLIDAALAVRQNAYSKYSNYRVGAALLDDRGVGLQNLGDEFTRDFLRKEEHRTAHP